MHKCLSHDGVSQISNTAIDNATTQQQQPKHKLEAKNEEVRQWAGLGGAARVSCTVTGEGGCDVLSHNSVLAGDEEGNRLPLKLH